MTTVSKRISALLAQLSGSGLDDLGVAGDARGLVMAGRLPRKGPLFEAACVDLILGCACLLAVPAVAVRRRFAAWMAEKAREMESEAEGQVAVPASGRMTHPGP